VRAHVVVGRSCERQRWRAPRRRGEWRKQRARVMGVSGGLKRDRARGGPGARRWSWSERGRAWPSEGLASGDLVDNAVRQLQWWAWYRRALAVTRGAPGRHRSRVAWLEDSVLARGAIGGDVSPRGVDGASRARSLEIRRFWGARSSCWEGRSVRAMAPRLRECYRNRIDPALEGARASGGGERRGG
jgi:hypothetical protein